MADIFLQIDDEQHGPYTAEQIQEWLRDGTVEPDTFAWREGMEDWQPLAQWGGDSPAAVFQRQFAQVPAMPQKVEPYYPPGAGYVPSTAMGGFGRMMFFAIWFLSNLLIWGAFGIGVVFVTRGEAMKTLTQATQNAIVTGLLCAFIAAVIIAIAIFIWLGRKRLTNIGWHEAWVLLIFIPGLNLPFIFALFALPPAFAREKQFDGPVWAWVVVLLIVIGAATIGVMTTDTVDRSRDFIKTLPGYLEHLPFFKKTA